MFESIRQGGCTNPMANVSSLFASVVVHAVILSLLMVVPMVFFRVLPQKLYLITLFPTEGFHVSTIPPPEISAGGRQNQNPSEEPPVSRTEVPLPEDWIPDFIPKGIPAPPHEPLLLTAIPAFPTGSGPFYPIGETAEKGMNLFAWPDPGPIRIPDFPVVKAAMVRIGQLDPSKRLYKVDPVYPYLARIAHIEGDVRLEAVVDETGCIAEVRVLDGHPLLATAAVDAVKRWVYSPTIQNGEPVRIQAIVTVRFRLNR